jgi:hypothetical protein
MTPSSANTSASSARRRSTRRSRVRERDEEGVALVVDLVATMAVERLAQQAPMQTE